jgi:hypothetical protein
MAPLPLLAMLVARLQGGFALEPVPIPSKHWPRAVAVRVVSLLVLVTATALLLAAAVRTSALLPLARWIWH